MIKFPHIEQFRNVVKSVELRATYKGDDSEGRPIYEPTTLPVLDFEGTVKLHGTNSAVVWENDAFYFQSREREISVTDDNCGFASFANKHLDYFSMLLLQIDPIFQYKSVAIFGEWCGKGIQKGVAISELEKMFVIFAIKGDDKWLDISNLDHDEERRIFNIHKFGKYNITIDFNKPSECSERLTEITSAVEKECPVGKSFGVSGVGEGVVWTCVSDGYNDDKFIFKVKGEKHSVSNVKTTSLLDVEKLNSIKECVDAILPENRLQRGISYLSDMGKDFDVKNLGMFLKWVCEDAIREENDTIVESGFLPKDLNKELNAKARTWFLGKLT